MAPPNQAARTGSPPEHGSSTPAPQLTLRRRLLLGGVVASLSVVLFLGLLEGGLRLAGYGHETRFFREVRGPDGGRWRRDNRDFTLAWFPPALVRRPQSFRLPAVKAPGAYRVFVLGSSAAMGDPEPSFSIGRTLEAMLREAYPGIRFEVVNAAITAINSHVVRAVAADCAALEPDLFIVYEGHNEVIGPFGPAGVLAPFLRSSAAIRLTVALRRTRTGQLLGALARRAGGQDAAPDDWGGLGMFLKQELAHDDPRLDEVQAAFAENLHDIVASAGSAGARTLLCTVLANQKDFAPFLSQHRPDLTGSDRQRWEAALAAGDQALAAGDAPAAEAHYRAAWAIDDAFAALAFRLGRVCLAAGRDDEARRFLARALDLDTLRFRTDSRLNDTIRAVAAQRADSAELVDLAALAAAQSLHGIAGDELLYEHVHLNFTGTCRVAAALFDRVGADLVRRGLVAAPAAAPLSCDELRPRLAYTAYEQALIIRELLARFAKPPFTAQLDHEARMAAWRQRAAAADRLLERPESRAALAAIYEQALQRRPDDWMLARNFGMALVAQGEPRRGIPWLEKALAVVDDEADTLAALALALQAAGRPGDAAAVSARLRELEPRYPDPLAAPGAIP